jgi:replicative DNA helicase
MNEEFASGSIPPQNNEAEQEVLGAILLDNSAIAKIDLTTEDFYKKSHSILYRAMLSLHTDNTPIDLITICEILKKDGTLEQIGGISYLSTLVSLTPTAANIKVHADIVKEKAIKRRLRSLCLETIGNIEEQSLDDLLGYLRHGTAQMVTGRGGDIITTAEIATELLEFVERRRKHRNELSGIKSGFTELDRITDGFQPGDLIIVGGRPSHGKSIFATTCAENSGEPVGVISLEMGPHQMGIRTLSSLSKVEIWKLRKGLFFDTDWPSIHDALSRLSKIKMYFSFTSFDELQIERAITQMVERYGIKMLIVDYLQLTKGATPKKREQEVAGVSRMLKLTAKAHNIPVMALSQLNRKVEEREGKKPMLSDLRESGAIEQDADVVLLLFRANCKEDGIVEVNVAKGRNTGLGEVKLWFKGDMMTFDETIPTEMS